MKPGGNKLLLVGIAPVFIGFLVLARLEVPCNIASVGLVLPLREWSLVQAPGGNLISSLKDNRTGKLHAYAITTFQRGNDARFTLNPRLYQSLRIRQGDTIAATYTNKNEELLVQLQAELAAQRSELRVYSTGQKPDDVQGAAEKLALARVGLETQRRMTRRTRELYRDTLVAAQEYEAALAALHSRELEVKIVTSNYHSATTGGKPEQLKYLVAKINVLQARIQQIKTGFREAAIVSPVSGVATRQQDPANPTEESIVSIADDSGYVLLLPVAYSEKNYIVPHQLVEAEITGTRQKCGGEIISIDNTAQLIDGKQAFFATAVLTRNSALVVPGTYLRTTVIGQPVAIGNYLARALGALFFY